MDFFVRLKKIAILVLCVALLLPPQFVFAANSANYILNFDSINSGGEDLSSSTNYRIRDTFGEQGSGDSSSTNFQAQAGYRAGDTSTSTALPYVPSCGNGITDAGEQCDAGGSNGACPATCSAGCVINSCGGGVPPPPPVPPPVQKAPVISNIQVTNITTASVHISWTTDKSANSEVRFGLTNQYTGGTVSNPAFGLTHDVDLFGLSPFTTYHFIVNSVDTFGLGTTSDDQTFITKIVVNPPQISNVTVTQITDSSALVSWKTDVPATSIVKFGLTNKYGSVTSVGGVTLSHAVVLSGLTQKTTYHFLPQSADANGQFSEYSADGTFTTLVDLKAPANVSNFTAIPGDTKVMLSWVNPADPDLAGVRINRKLGAYPTGPADGIQVYSGLGQAVTDNGLVNGTAYFYRAFAFDGNGNFASGALATATPAGVNQPIPPVPPQIPPVQPPQILPGQGGGNLPPGQGQGVNAVVLGVTYFSSGVQLEPDANGIIGVLSGSQVETRVRPSVAIDEVVQASMRIAGSVYALTPSVDNTYYSASFIAPVSGTYEAVYTFVFKTLPTTGLKNNILSQPSGKVVESAYVGPTENALPGATVQLYQNSNGV